jgi:adenylate cyclase
VRNVPARRRTCALGAKYALEGSIRAAGQKVRVSAELTEAASGRIIWSEQFDPKAWRCPMQAGTSRRP